MMAHSENTVKAEYHNALSTTSMHDLPALRWVGRYFPLLPFLDFYAVPHSV